LILGLSKPRTIWPPISSTGTPIDPLRRMMSRAAAASRLTSTSRNLILCWRR